MTKILGAVFLFILSSSALAWTIGPMNYQGRLLDGAGVPVTATLPFNVRIYDAASGGTLKFSEQHNSVAVDDGVYSFLVSTGTGSTGAWDIALWNTPQLFLEIEVNGETLTPRHLMAAAPYAFQANLALTTNNALALGGKTASEYQNILADICASSKGKWLTSLNKCLGSGAVITNQVIPASDGLNYSNLELINVDLTGTHFPTSADFSGTSFKNSTVSFAGFHTANLSGTRFENITATTPLTTPGDIYQSYFKNINMTGFTLGSSNLSGVSAAELSACPSTLPAGGYSCREQFTGSGRYFIYGPSMNFSSTSALATASSQGTTLQLRSDVFSGAAGLGHSLQTTNFSGVRIPSHLTGMNLTGANFSDAVLDRLDLSNCNLNNSNFDRAKISQVTLTNATIGFVTFKGAEISLTSMQNGDYTNAKLDKVILSGISNASTFNNTVISDSSLSIGFLTPVLFSSSFFTGTIHITQGSGLNTAALYNTTFNNCTFTNATFVSEILYTNTSFNPGLVCGTVVFSNNKFRSFQMRFNQAGQAANNLTFTNNQFGATLFSGNMTNASFSGSTLFPGSDSFGGLMFKSGTICPNGTTQNNSGGDYFTCGTAGNGQTNW